MVQNNLEVSIAEQRTKLEFLEVKINSMAESMSMLATDMRQLALAQAKRDEDMLALRRVFERIEALEEEVQLVKDTALQETIRRQQAIIDEHKKTAGRLWGEVFRTAGAVTVALILYHFGVHINV